MNLNNIISQYISLPPQRTNGWHPILCKVCNDHGKKGPRAAFRFQDDTIVYNCFNCGHVANYNVYKTATIPDSMQEVFNAFGIPLDIWSDFQIQSLTSEKRLSKKKQKTLDVNIPPTVKLLPFFRKLTDDTTSLLATLAKEYLEVRRGIDFHDYDFYICDDKSVKNTKAFADWYGRLIIPTTFNNNIIFYQGRGLLDQAIKYKSSSGDRGGIMFGYDHVRNLGYDEPIYVTEGFFDSYHLGGVGIIGNKISTKQAYWLNKLPNKKIYIPDHHQTGFDAGMQALSHGWDIATPDIGQCKDINDAVVKYGILYVLDALQSSQSSGQTAKIKLKLYCSSYIK